MTGFILRRVLSSVVVVILTSIFVFVLFYKGLGDAPARNYCEKLGPGKCSAQKLDSIEHQMGLDKSVAANYEVWAKGIFAGRHDVYVDGKLYECPAPCLGISISSGHTVWHDLEDKYPATIVLAVGGSAIGLVLGVLLGSLAALWRGSAADRLLVGGSLVVSAVPFYIIALLSWIYLTLQLKIFPTTGYFPITQNPARTAAWMMLPWLVIGLTSCTQYARFTRAQVVETLAEDYIRTAMSKGVPASRVLFKHALRAAIVPVTTIFGLNFAALLAGTIFTERIFEIDGIGKWSLDALQTPIDLQVVSATVLVSAILVVVANLLVDVFYSFLDPRTSVS
ncbi:MAG: peptide/nickel transport system permease protein [Nocardioidaceae bacterium]|jgi:peptide/nickel transport system permease protein|nr:peptide/nickel transport system permease protein [Nocardioidaceae bacterium]